jgi:hypothetical protein
MLHLNMLDKISGNLRNLEHCLNLKDCDDVYTFLGAGMV